MKWTRMILAVLPISCGSGEGSRDECVPLNYRCEGDVMFHCSLDIELLRQGEHVYVWQEAIVCADDAGFDETCVETEHANGRVSAECGFVDELQDKEPS
jgi:hypothetical protein